MIQAGDRSRRSEERINAVLIRDRGLRGVRIRRMNGVFGLSDSDRFFPPKRSCDGVVTVDLPINRRIGRFTETSQTHALRHGDASREIFWAEIFVGNGGRQI